MSKDYFKILYYSNLDTFSSILSSLGLLIGAIGSILLAYKGIIQLQNRRNQSLEQSNVHVLTISEEIQLIIEKMKKSIESNAEVSIIKITNGGKQLQPENPIYVESLYSTNKDVQTIWANHKMLLTGVYRRAIKEAVEKRHSVLKIADTDMQSVKDWAKVYGITIITYYLIGHKNYTTYLFAISSADNKNISEEKQNMLKLLFMTSTLEVKQLFNSNKKCYQSKIK